MCVFVVYENLKRVFVKTMLIIYQAYLNGTRDITLHIVHLLAVVIPDDYYDMAEKCNKHNHQNNE